MYLRLYFLFRPSLWFFHSLGRSLKVKTLNTWKIQKKSIYLKSEKSLEVSIQGMGKSLKENIQKINIFNLFYMRSQPTVSGETFIFNLTLRYFLFFFPLRVSMWIASTWRYLGNAIFTKLGKLIEKFFSRQFNGLWNDFSSAKNFQSEVSNVIMS